MLVNSKQFMYSALASLTIGSLLVGAGNVRAAKARDTVTLSGAGSTFVAPVLNGQWVPGYAKLHSNVQVAYDAIGSGAGISLLTKGNIDFAGSDALPSSSQTKLLLKQCQGGLATIPVTIGAVALIYNLPGVKTGLKLSPDVVAGIFLGSITSWSDARIAHLNAGVSLPSTPIQTVHRADGSGTSYIFTHYLADISSAWKSKVGSGATVAWPNGTGAPKSSGVSAAVSRTPGAISYVDLAYAVANKLSAAIIQNKSGQFVAPGVTSASAAADSFAKSMPANLQQVIVNSPAAQAYPITGYSYVFMCQHQSGAKGKALVNFVKYVVTTGQAKVQALYYAPLPTSVQHLDSAALAHL